VSKNIKTVYSSQSPTHQTVFYGIFQANFTWEVGKQDSLGRVKRTDRDCK